MSAPLHRTACGVSNPTETVNLREREALSWAARGKTSHEIAIILGLTKRTVDFHLDAARVKLNAVTRIHAVALAVAGQIVQI